MNSSPDDTAAAAQAAAAAGAAPDPITAEDFANLLAARMESADVIIAGGVRAGIIHPGTALAVLAIVADRLWLLAPRDRLLISRQTEAAALEKARTRP